MHLLSGCPVPGTGARTHEPEGLTSPTPRSFSLSLSLPTFSALFCAGFLALPWLWGLNAWLFWPVLAGHAGHGDDPVVKQCEWCLC